MGGHYCSLRKHFEPKRPIIAVRFHFHKRDQAIGESIADCMAVFLRLSTHCKFEGYLEDTLRGHCVCGLRNEAMQRRLLAEVDLTLFKAMDLAQGTVAADKHTRSFKEVEPSIKQINSRRQLVYPNYAARGCIFIEAVMLVARRAILPQLVGPNL